MFKKCGVSGKMLCGVGSVTVQNCCNVSLLFVGAVTSMTGAAACWLFIVHCTL